MKNQVSEKRREQLRRYCREYWERNSVKINARRRAKYAENKKAKAETARTKEG